MAVTCVKCRSEIECQPLYRLEGDLELTLLRCPTCGKEYLSAVTDTPLRRSIEKYKEMLQTIRTGKVTESFILDAQELLAENMLRGKELKDEYLRHNVCE